MCDIEGRVASTFLSVAWCFNFIIANVENAVFHKHVVQNGRNAFKDILEIVENSVLVTNQQPKH